MLKFWQDPGYTLLQKEGCIILPGTDDDHLGADVVSGEGNDDVLASTTGIVRIADTCTNCDACFDRSSTPPHCGYRNDESPANWGVGSVIIVEYTYESLPPQVRKLLKTGESLYVQYQHLSSISVETDQIVTGGEMIAQMGNTGISEGPHLHVEVKSGASGIFNDFTDYSSLFA